jgi:diacylglycerol kinase (ATP)
MTTTVILNPRARGGLAAREAPSVIDRLRSLDPPLRLVETRYSGHATDLARQAIAEGATRLIAIGGDGTASETVNGYLGRDGAIVDGAPAFGFVPLGTGGDWCRSLGFDGTAGGALERIAVGATRRVDLGRIRFIADDGTPTTRLFTNIASFGLSGPVDRAVNRFKASRYLSGRAVFKIATLAALVRYRFQRVAIRVDGGPVIEARIAVVAIANGAYFGGGMWVAPPARLDDGLLDIIVVRGATKSKLARDMNRVYLGSHMQDEDTSHVVGASVTVEPLDETDTGAVLLDIDGESPGRLPATFDLLPRAIEVLV